ncbi:MAG: methionine--tRNA ligase [Candidatus Nanopelagicales bacterium]
MTSQDLYVTTSIPYVNGAPHLGHALELVQVDALARHRRRRGGAARVQSGTDDHALKNVSAAAASGVGVADLVRTNGDRFVELAAALGVRTDEFLRTSSDSRHEAGVAALWEACRAAGDLYEKEYAGRYCAGCEQFYAPDELVDGRCAEHGTEPELVTETNWFFRLSAYRERILDLVARGELVVEPEQRRNEVVGFLRGEVHDLSVSRPASRAGGWGIPAPGDPDQVVYVWFDALTNYLTGLGYGSADDAAYRRWWREDVDRTHVVGKGIVRFHAVFWVAFLLSAGVPVPSRVLVHDYLTVDGAKIAKSGAQAADPASLVEAYGADAVRWWLLREPAPVGTCDFTEDRLVAAADRDLANCIGNLASRTVALAARRPAAGPATAYDVELAERVDGLAAQVDAALARYDLRAACQAVVGVAEAGNRYVEAEAPWVLAKAAEAGDTEAGARFDAVIATLLHLCRTVADELEPFVPDGAARLQAQLAAVGSRTEPAFPRLAAR